MSEYPRREAATDVSSWLDAPHLIAVDGKGYVWRAYLDESYWSMAPTNPDNSPIPEPVTYYAPVGTGAPGDATAIAAAVDPREDVAELRDRLQAVLDPDNEAAVETAVRALNAIDEDVWRRWWPAQRNPRIAKAILASLREAAS